jgi:hypothetical protein
MVMVFPLKSRTAPISCKVCLSMIRLYKGDGAPTSYSTISGVRRTDLLAEHSIKEMSIVPTFFCLKGAVGSAPRLWHSPLHSWYVLLRPFFDEKEVTTQSCVKQYPYSFLFNY